MPPIAPQRPIPVHAPFGRGRLHTPATATPTAPTPGADATAAFFDCRLTHAEVAILVFLLIASMALQCAPVLISPLALPLIIAMAALSWMSPVTGMFYIACAQSLPFPEHAPFNPAQLGVVTWAGVALLRYRGLRFRGFRHILMFLPYLLWMELLYEEPVFGLNSEYMKALVYAVIGCQLVNEAKGQYLKCLLGICLGGLMVTNAYWGAAFGLPIQLSDWGGARQEFVRVGGARADSIMVWPPTLFGTFGIIGIAFAAMSKSTPRQASALKWLAGTAFIMSLPPLLATMSNAAYLGWVIMLGWTLALFMALRRRGHMSGHIARRIQTILIVLMIGLGICYQLDVLKIRSRMHALEVNYAEQSEEFGVAASRTLDWWYSVKSIATHPVTGRAFATEPEECPPGYALRYERGLGDFFSHNVFLDSGRLAGVPGMIMLLTFFFYPQWRMWRKRQYDRHMAFMLGHFAFTLFWMVLSFPFYKTFWAFWILACIAADNPPPARRAPAPHPIPQKRPEPLPA